MPDGMRFLYRDLIDHRWNWRLLNYEIKNNIFFYRVGPRKSEHMDFGYWASSEWEIK